ncbi:hypothetical protein [Leisingera caerulea]|uniref:hypothetical protein n=1 Tax=Leisingera caerulea TaxID=506591 RepID=UPI0005695CA4|nr:hypothetical protein [Leisingera caerulea]
MFPRGLIAMTFGFILLGGHAICYFVITSNDSVSPSSKSDVVAIFIPLTVAALTSAALYAVKHADIKLSETARANVFFAVFAIVVPLMFFYILVDGLWKLDGDQSVDDFKRYVVAAEAVFGGVFTIMSEAVFGKPREGTR